MNRKESDKVWNFYFKDIELLSMILLSTILIPLIKLIKFYFYVCFVFF